MRDLFKYLSKRFLRIILRFFYIFPIKQNKVFFMCDMGKHYACNPKYIFLELGKNHGLEIIWAFQTPKDYRNYDELKYAKLVSKRNFLSFFFHLLTAKVIVYNCGGFSYCPIRKKQFLIETWHGGGAYKKCGLSLETKSKFSKKGIMLAMQDVKLFLATSTLAEKKFINECMGYSGAILESGFPRNDIFFIDEEEKNKIKEKIRAKYNFGFKKLVLYAPTFKGNEWDARGLDKEHLIDTKVIKEALNERFGGDWLFLIRGHQYAKDISLVEHDYDVSDYLDMQELLLLVDVLITDYSSSIWDFSITRKPCFLFVPDIKQYESLDRGFLTPISMWPGIVCETNTDISNNIKMFEEKLYQEKIDKIQQEYNSFEKGKAAKIVVQKIKQVVM